MTQKLSADFIFVQNSFMKNQFHIQKLEIQNFEIFTGSGFMQELGNDFPIVLIVDENMGWKNEMQSLVQLFFNDNDQSFRQFSEFRLKILDILNKKVF